MYDPAEFARMTREYAAEPNVPKLLRRWRRRRALRMVGPALLLAWVAAGPILLIVLVARHLLGS
jgi:hypothetical protein